MRLYLCLHEEGTVGEQLFCVEHWLKPEALAAEGKAGLCRSLERQSRCTPPWSSICLETYCRCAVNRCISYWIEWAIFCRNPPSMLWFSSPPPSFFRSALFHAWTQSGAFSRCCGFLLALCFPCSLAVLGFSFWRTSCTEDLFCCSSWIKAQFQAECFSMMASIAHSQKNQDLPSSTIFPFLTACF